MRRTLSSISTISEHNERLLGFSDAVFAIAMTFLALDLGAIPDDVGDPGGPTTAQFLAENIPDYVVYFGTFLMVAYLWWRHHLMFRYIKRSSTLLVWLNTLMLALVAMLPYPAAVLSEAYHFAFAFVLLLVPLTLIGLFQWLAWEAAVVQKLIIPDTPAATIRYIRGQVMASPIVLALASVLAYVGWQTGSHMWLRIGAALWALLIVIPLVLRHFYPPPDKAYEFPEDELPDVWKSRDELDAERSRKVRSSLERLRNGSDTDRIKILTDGVVAIAVTILALQLRPPHVDGELTDEVLVENFQSVPWWTYLVTFVLISLFWRGHVRIFTAIRGADPAMLWLNLLFLMSIAFLPMTAALIAQSPDTTATAFYLLVMFLAGISMAGLGQYGSRAKGLEVALGTERERLVSSMRSITAAFAFLVALILVVVFDAPILSNVVWVIFIVAGQWSRWLLRNDGEAAMAST